MTIHLLYFGVLKEIFQAERDACEIPAHSTVADPISLVRARSPAGVAIWKSLAVAVNREYAALETTLHDGDEVALLPPVSGGSHAR